MATTNASAWHLAGQQGAGVKVAVIDGGFVGYASAQASGDLPASLTTVDDCSGQFLTATNHGTAVAGVVHKMAPAAQLYLICVGTEVQLAQAEAYAKANGIQVINHSMVWYNTSRGDGSGGPGTPDATVADASANGILWVNAAGNDAQRHWSVQAGRGHGPDGFEASTRPPRSAPQAGDEHRRRHRATDASLPAMSDALQPEVARPPAPGDEIPPAPKNGRPSGGRANGRERADGHDRPNGHTNGRDGLDATGRAILRMLCEAGATSPDLLATRLGLSRTCALQRLRELAMAGFVARQAIRHGVGRPRHLYDVTPAAQAILPANYDGLATTLLESIEQVGGGALVDEVFQTRRRLLRERIRTRLVDRLGEDAALDARVRELAVLQDDAGYVARLESGPDGGFELVLHNCAILGAAAGHPAACRAEIELYEDVFDAHVTRLSHIASGDRTCTYRIEPRR